MKRLPLVAALLLCSATALLAEPARTATYPALLSGKVVPLTVKLKQLDGNWRTFMASGAQDQRASYSALYGLPGGGYYTQGQTVAVGQETYLVAYALETKQGALPMMFGRGAVKPEEISGESPLRLALLNVRTMGSMTGIRPFDLTREVAAFSAAYAALQTAMDTQMEAASTEGPQEELEEGSVGANLKSVVIAVEMYVADYEAFPPMDSVEGFAEAVADYLESEEVLLDPDHHEYFSLNATLSLRAAGDVKDASKTVLAYQLTPSEDGSRWVGFADGHVKKYAAADWEKLKADQKLP
jgi:hypothetical protein